jgi:hypothetical protein
MLRRMTLGQMQSKGAVNRLARWLRRRAGEVREETFLRAETTTVETVQSITVESIERTVFLGFEQAGDLEACPLCGARLGPHTDHRMPPQLRSDNTQCGVELPAPSAEDAPPETGNAKS